jgi:thiol-disulfide isomerase/thioredoxin
MRVISAVFLVSFVVAGCGADGAAGPTAADSTPASPASTTAPATTPSPGKPAAAGKLAFTGTTLDGKPFDATTLAGRPVLIWFWAPWCPTCVAEAPDVLDVQRMYGGKVGILGVAGLDEPDNMQPFVDRTKTGVITHLSDPEGAIWRRFEVTQQSTYVLLDASGQVTFTGVLGGDELRDRVAALAG